MWNVNNGNVGNYLANLIEQKYHTQREFCRAYLRMERNGQEPRDVEKDDQKPRDEDIGRMANRLSQILKGAKAIQTYDLPIFSQLLGVSIEEILSGGKQRDSKYRKPSNYSIAQSHDRAEWIAYISNEKQPVLNTDEYGYTLLEYAIQFENYDLIRFLVKEKYIWFEIRRDRLTGSEKFVAGTNIQRIKFDEEDGVFIRRYDWDDLQQKISTEDQLRRYIISFAVDRDDIEMLEKLQARNIPELQNKVNYLYIHLPEFEILYEDVADMVEHVAKASNRILAYFTEPFPVSGGFVRDEEKRKHMFVFPYSSQLLDQLIENRAPYLKTALERMVAHNESTEERLRNMIDRSKENQCYSIVSWKDVLGFDENGGFIHFFDTTEPDQLITNIVKVTKKSDDPEIAALIERLNGSYERMKNLKN